MVLFVQAAQASKFRVMDFVKFIFRTSRDPQCAPLVLELLVAPAHDVAADVRLEERHDPGEPLVTHVLQGAQHSGSEKHLKTNNHLLHSIPVDGNVMLEALVKINNSNTACKILGMAGCTERSVLIVVCRRNAVAPWCDQV